MSRHYNLGSHTTQLYPTGAKIAGLAKALEIAESGGVVRVLYVSSSSAGLRRFVCLVGEGASRLNDVDRGGVSAPHLGVTLEQARGMLLHVRDSYTHVVCDVCASAVTDVQDWVTFIRSCTKPVYVAYRPNGVAPIVSRSAARLAAADADCSVRVAMLESDWDAIRRRRETLREYPSGELDDGDEAAREVVAAAWMQRVSSSLRAVDQAADGMWVQDARKRPRFAVLRERLGGAPLTDAQVLAELRRGALSRLLTLSTEGSWGLRQQRQEQREESPWQDVEMEQQLASMTGVDIVQRRSWLSSTSRLFRLLPPAVARLVKKGSPVTVTRADSDRVALRLSQLHAEEGDGGVVLADSAWASLWRRASGRLLSRPSVRLVVGVLERLGYGVAGEERRQVGGARVRAIRLERVADMALGRRLEATDSAQLVEWPVSPYSSRMEKLATLNGARLNLPPSAMSLYDGVSEEHTAAAAIYASRFPTSDADPLHARCLVYQPEAVEAALASRNTAGARVMTQKDQARGLAGAALVRTHSRPLPDGRMLLPIPPRAQWAEQREQARVEVTYLGGSRTSLQCVSREARRAMRPLAGYRFVSVDMVCAHLRIAEALCRVLSPSNKFFAKLFDGGDLYKSFGELTGLSREEAKKAAIMLLNGATDEGLLKEYPHLTAEACARAVEAWRKGNPWCTKTSHSIAGHAEAAARYQRVRGFKKRATDKGASTYTSLWLQMEENRMLQSALRELDGELQLVLPMYDGALFVVPDGQEEAAAAKAAAAFYRAAAACGYGRIEMKAGHGDTWGDAETNSTRRVRT